jgi:general secretion pathway protein G
MLRSLRFQQGFTLIETLIVVSIIGILSAVVLSSMNPIDQLGKGRDSKKKQDLAEIQRALEAYYHDNGRYPPHIQSGASYQIQGGSGTKGNWGKEWQPYMNVVPQDTAGARYTYIQVQNGQAYYLYASLERGGKDPQACAGGSKCTNAPNNACGSARVCNYGVTSPNVSP